MDYLSLVIGALLSAIPTIIVALVQEKRSRGAQNELQRKIEQLTGAILNIKDQYDLLKLQQLEQSGKPITEDDRKSIASASAQTIIQSAPFTSVLFFGSHRGEPPAGFAKRSNNTEHDPAK